MPRIFLNTTIMKRKHWRDSSVIIVDVEFLKVHIMLCCWLWASFGNPFHVAGLFLQNQRFSDVYREYRRRSVISDLKWINKTCPENSQNSRTALFNNISGWVLLYRDRYFHWNSILLFLLLSMFLFFVALFFVRTSKFSLRLDLIIFEQSFRF